MTSHCSFQIIANTFQTHQPTPVFTDFYLAAIFKVPVKDRRNRNILFILQMHPERTLG